MSSDIEIIHRGKCQKEFSQILELLEKEISVSSLYTGDAISYYEQRYIDDGHNPIDLSRILRHEGKPIWAFLGFKYEIKSQCKISLCEIPATFIEAPHLTKKAKRSIQEEIVKIKDMSLGAEKINIIEHPINGQLTHSTSYLISRYEHKSSLSFARIINLRMQEQQIKSNIRKSYKSLISWGLREISINYMTTQNANWTAFKKFIDLHILCAGRKTRSNASWSKQFEAIKNGTAFCVLGEKDGELITAGLFMISRTHCYYGVSASRRDMFDKPIFHSLMWKAILYAKSINIKYFETGKYYSYDENLSLDKKEESIALFKAGFGGEVAINIVYELQ